MSYRSQGSPRLEVPHKSASTPSTSRSLYRFACIVGWGLTATLFLVLLGGRGSIQIANVAGPLVVLVACLLAAFDLVRHDTDLCLTPLPWFMASSAAYYGFGALLHEYGSADTIGVAQSFWQTSDSERSLVSLLNQVCLLSVAIGAGLLINRRKQFRTSKSSVVEMATDLREAKRARLVIGLSVIVGFSIKLLFTVPSHFGWTQGPPGVVRALGSLSTMAILLASFLWAKGLRSYRFLVYASTTMEVILGAVTLDKLDLLLPVAFAFVGYGLGRRSVRPMLVGGAVVILAFAALQPTFGTARNRLWHRDGEVAGPVETLEELSRIVLEDRDLDTSLHASQQWWLRLSTTNAQAFAMHLHDSGQLGYTYGRIGWFFVPRILFPEKPQMTDAGLYITEQATGHRLSSTGLTAFGEAYWNGGWILAILSSLVLGMILASITRTNLRFLRERRWAALPLAVMGIELGIAHAGWFTTSYIGGTVIYYALVLPFLRIRKPPRGSRPRRGTTAPAQ